MKDIMINSFSKYSATEILYPGIVLYNGVYDISSNDIENVISSKGHIDNTTDKYYNGVRNKFFKSFEYLNNVDFAENIQSGILYYFAKYCDLYPEVVHCIQWQENIFIDCLYAGQIESGLFNSKKSDLNKDGFIKNTPFSRQVAIEISIDDQYNGGGYEWPYLNNVKMNKFTKGSVLFYPADFIYSKKQNLITSGRKIILTTFLNGGKDFLAEENFISDDEDSNMLFSYMR